MGMGFPNQAAVVQVDLTRSAALHRLVRDFGGQHVAEFSCRDASQPVPRLELIHEHGGAVR